MRNGVREWAAVLAVLIIAAGLRFYRLDAQSFWNDEGNSARIAERSLALITEGAAGDIHPPLYYYVLHVWRGMFGASEFALRSLSAALGVLLVWLTYLIARQVFDHRIGVVAALVAALNPFQVYYSQEARMYLLLAVIGAAATSQLLSLLVNWSTGQSVDQSIRQPVNRRARQRITLSPRQLVILSLVILYAAGLYTHYAFPFIIVAHFIIVLTWVIVTRRSLRNLLPWIGLATAAGVLFIPWLPTALRQITTWPSGRVTLDAGSMLLDTFRLYVLGPTFPTAEAITAILISGFFLLVGLWNPHGFDERRAEEAVLLPHSVRVGAIGLWWLIPIALIFGFGLFKESYLKFLLIGSAAFCILLARGLVTALGIARGALNMPRELAGQPVAIWSWTLVVAFLGALIAVPTAQSINNYYFDSGYARDDYRGIAQTIKSQQRADDAVILDSANQWEVFTYYYPDGPNVYPLPRSRPLDPAAIEAELTALAQKYRRVFVLYWGDTEADPNKVIESWLDAHTYKATEQWIGAVRFVTYAIPMQLSNQPQQMSRVRLGEHITLDGFTLPTARLAPGDILQLDLFWRTDAKLSERYKVFVHVLDATGVIAAQTDREPGGGRNLTTDWNVNEPIVDRYGVLIPETAASGIYSIEMGLYDLNNIRLKMADGKDAVMLAKVEVMSDK
ncbi:MAG: glycosyltransferase family 39 protein [Chloroflexi bacterium]|nr:glycosyltransferase family 39 protein [Chloroflexota bacterium]